MMDVFLLLASAVMATRSAEILTLEYKPFETKPFK